MAAKKKSTPTRPPHRPASRTRSLGAAGRSAATVASVASSATVVNIFARNDLTTYRTLQNESTAVLYLKYGAGASATDYTYLVAANARWDRPSADPYNGLVTGLWAAANGAARTTEV